MTSHIPSYSPTNLPLLIMMFSGGIAACIAEIITIPLDTAKVRLQIQGQKIAHKTTHYTGVINCLLTMMKTQGSLSVFTGLFAGLQRQIIFASLRIGLYQPVKNFYVGNDYEGRPIPLYYRILAGLTTGAFGICVANPTVQEIQKGCYQNKISGRGEEDALAYYKIFKQEGIRGFWTGIIPNIFRNSIINAAELASYDQAKSSILNRNFMQDNIFLHFICSTFAGFNAVLIGSPVDVIKTRIMNADKAGGHGYSGIFDCIYRTATEEGLSAFYKGFIPNAGRIISWNICMFMSLQQIRLRVFEHFYKKDE